jgi:hypothetical protein
MYIQLLNIFCIIVNKFEDVTLTTHKAPSHNINSFFFYLFRDFFFFFFTLWRHINDVRCL